MEDKTKQEVMSYIITVSHKCFETLTMRNSKTETETPPKLLLWGPAWWKRLLVWAVAPGDHLFHTSEHKNTLCQGDTRSQFTLLARATPNSLGTEGGICGHVNWSLLYEDFIILYGGFIILFNNVDRAHNIHRCTYSSFIYIIYITLYTLLHLDFHNNHIS